MIELEKTNKLKAHNAKMRDYIVSLEKQRRDNYVSEDEHLFMALTHSIILIENQIRLNEETFNL